MTTSANIEFSFGRNLYVNFPKLNQSLSWEQFGRFLDTKRAPSKRTHYICSDFTNDGRRLLVNAKNRNWLPLDMDGNLSDDEFRTLLEWCGTFKSYVYETSSSLPNARRARIILLLDRAVTDEEGRALGELIASHAPVKEEYWCPKKEAFKSTWDRSVYRANQVLFLPTAGSPILSFDGAPANVSRLFEGCAATT